MMGLILKSGEHLEKLKIIQEGNKMRSDICSCWEACKMNKPCGNKHCSANPHYIPPAKRGKKIKQGQANDGQ